MRLLSHNCFIFIRVKFELILFYILPFQQEMVNYGCTEICELLLNCGASPDISGYKTRRPLHEAAKFNRIKEAKLLLHYNADRSQYDQYGKKPMYVYFIMTMKNIIR